MQIAIESFEMMDASHFEQISENGALLRDVFRRASSFIPSGVAVVAGFEPEAGPFGLTVSTLTSVSIEPPLVSICVDRGSRALALLRQVKSFSVNLLAHNQGDLARRFGTPGTDRFKDLHWKATQFGTPVLDGVIGVMLCDLASDEEAGDHQIMIAEVKRLALSQGEPLVYWRRGLHRVHRDYPFITDEATLQRFVKDWEAGVLAQRFWTHTAHVAVAAYYGFTHPPEEAFQRTKAGIVHYNTCVGTPNTEDSGYHETLTRFWSDVVGGFLRSHRFESQFNAVCQAVDVLGEDRDRHCLYYTFDVVRDRRARREWIPPDRMPLTGWDAEAPQGEGFLPSKAALHDP
jgi:flavin reductase ActVB